MNAFQSTARATDKKTLVQVDLKGFDDSARSPTHAHHERESSVARRLTAPLKCSKEDFGDTVCAVLLVLVVVLGVYSLMPLLESIRFSP